MKKEITLGNFIGTLVPILVILFTWGVSVESRIVELYAEMRHNMEAQARILSNQDKIQEELKEILIELQKKKNRVAQFKDFN